jgi:pimeloyl-ACP methyl ester carboxylesterase
LTGYDRDALRGSGRFVAAGRVRLFVHELGEGAPLLLVHGYGVSHLEFRHVLGALAEGGRVLAPDLPGHGESEAPADYSYDYPAIADTVADLLDGLHLGRVAVLGHSMGGGVALQLAVRHAARVERLLLSDAACYPVRLPLEGRLPLLPVVGPLLFRHVYGLRDLRRYFRKRVYRDAAALDEELLAYYWDRVNERRDAAYAGLRMVAAADGLADLPARVRCPTLVLWGEHDRIFPVEHAERLAREIPGARLEILRDCGHAPQEERPDRFVSNVREFCGHV